MSFLWLLDSAELTWHQPVAVIENVVLGLLRAYCTRELELCIKQEDDKPISDAKAIACYWLVDSSFLRN